MRLSVAIVAAGGGVAHRALGGKGNPTPATVLKVLAALGMKMRMEERKAARGRDDRAAKIYTVPNFPVPNFQALSPISRRRQ